ncbi:MAG: Gfo/Idh/MocA family oxidoreductase [Planctomycetes bacterium]|nr:Gfo/Idh/MocA family oxidoreductase [Planctomycetota bacterium]
MQPLRWAIIGAGRFGRIHAQVLQQLPGVELTAVCSRTKEKVEAAAAELSVPRAFTDFRNLLEGDVCDVVTIATHWQEHFEPAMAALESGKHVLLEKPMAPTRDECRRLVEAARRANGAFMVGHVCRFDPRAAIVKRAVDGGRIGRIVSMHARRNLPEAPGSIRLDRISPLMGDGVHDADLMMWLLGRAPTRIYARNVRVDRFRYPDLGWAMLEFGDLGDEEAARREGAIGVIETNWRLPAKSPTAIDAVLQVVGTEGQITLDCGHAGVSIVDGAGLRFPDTAYWPELHGRRVGALYHELDYFAQCIRDGRRPAIITPEEAARAAAVMETAEHAAAQGLPLEFAADAL